jgi:DNA polymerase III subunit epsilon
MYLIYDVESGGLPDFKLPADAPGQPRLCSIAAALVDDKGKTVTDFYSLVKPEGWTEDVIRKAEHGAFAVNGLSMARLQREGAPILDVLDRFDAFIDQCQGIAAYGIAFDQKIMRGEMRRSGRPDRYGERPTFCIQQAAVGVCKIPPTDKMMAGGRKWFKTPNLGEAVEVMLGRSLEGAHDALVDLRATVAIFNIMRRDGLVQWKAQKAKVPA